MEHTNNPQGHGYFGDHLGVRIRLVDLLTVYLSHTLMYVLRSRTVEVQGTISTKANRDRNMRYT